MAIALDLFAVVGSSGRSGVSAADLAFASRADKALISNCLSPLIGAGELTLSSPDNASFGSQWHFHRSGSRALHGNSDLGCLGLLTVESLYSPLVGDLRLI